MKHKAVSSLLAALLAVALLAALLAGCGAQPAPPASAAAKPAGDSPDTVRATLTRISKYGDTTTETRTGVLTRGSVGFAFEGECWQLRCLRPDDENYEWAIALREDGTMTMANMGGNAEYSYISWMDLQRS